MKKMFLVLLSVCAALSAQAQETTCTVSVKKPGNPAVTYELQDKGDGMLKADSELPVMITRKTSCKDLGK